MKNFLFQKEYPLSKKITSLLKEMNILVVSKWFFYSILIGIIGGLGAVLFYFLLEQGKFFFSGFMGAYVSPAPAGESLALSNVGMRPQWWIFLLVPTLGGLISGFIVYTLAPEAEGHGTDALIHSFHRLRGAIRKRIPPIKTIASVITIASGGSAGREGPIAQIGAGFGSFLARTLNLSDRERRLMVLAGAGAGIGSIFKAPLGGALFATEVLYREPEFEFEAIIPCIISSIVAYSVFGSFYGWQAIFETPEFIFNHPMELFLYALLGLVCSVLGIIYVKIFYGLRDKFFINLHIPNHFKPAIGGFFLGVLAIFLPQVLGTGYGWIQLAIYGEMAIGVMLAVAAAKVLATSFTISSGGSGGVFAPSLTIGAMLGGAFGQICNSLFPETAVQPTAYVLVGMGGFFAGAAKVPIASLIMVCEMAGSYGLLVPLMLVSVVAYLLTGRNSLYEHQVSARIDSPAHRGDFIIDVLENLTVKDALKPGKEIMTIPEGMHFKEIINLVTNTTHSYFPVVNTEGKMTGIMSIDDIRRVLLDDQLNDLVIAKDIAISDPITVTLNENLNEVMGKFTIKNLDDLPVVSEDDPQELKSMISRREVLAAYNQEMKKRRES